MKTLTGHDGDWVVVRRGVYAERTLWECCDEDARYLLRVRAGALNLQRDAVISHGSSAVLRRMPMRPKWRKLVHVTRPGVKGGRTEGGIKHHLAGYEESDLSVVSGLTTTGLARTALDIGREFGFEDGVVACDAALRAGASRAELDRAIAPMTSWPRITGARAALEVADKGAENPGESLARLLILELDIGVPETQFEVVHQGRRAVADLRVGRHLFEFDGKVKYIGREQGGVADRPPEEILWAEKLREDWLRSLGWGVSRLIWDDLFGFKRRAAKQRLAREFLETLRRHAGAT